MTKPLCIYHAHCLDGFAAAWAVHHALGEGNVDFLAANYKDAPPDVAGRDVVIVDFSYKRPVLQAMELAARSILVLDHHESAEQELDGLGISCAEITGYTWQWWIEEVVPEMVSHDEESIGVLFDMDRSGAGITWDFFHDASRPALIDHVEDRDLWRFRLDDTREIMAAVMSYPQDFEEWDRLMLRMPLDDLVYEGIPLLRQKRKDVQEAIDQTFRHIEIGGHLVPVANVPKAWASDAGNILAEGNPFAATYFDGPRGREFSLRSDPRGLNVREIAQAYGGGGHHHAAGFRTPIGWEGDNA